jgi:hypothetical protein
MNSETAAQLKHMRPKLIRELRAAHGRLLKAKNLRHDIETILSALIFVLELDQNLKKHRRKHGR